MKSKKNSEIFITYIGMQRISQRRWVHLGFNEETKEVIVMPKNLIPKKPRPSYPTDDD